MNFIKRTSRAPLLNFAIPFIVLYPIPNYGFYWYIFKIFISIILLFFLLSNELEILKCRRQITKFILLCSGIISSFCFYGFDFADVGETKSELLGTIIKSNNTTYPDNYYCETARFISLPAAQKKWEGKEIILEKENSFSYENPILKDSFRVKGVVYSNESGVPFLKITKMYYCQDDNFFGIIYKYRNIYKDFIWEMSNLTPICKSFLLAFTTGDKEYVEVDAKEVYIRSGSMHLFAVSGLHFGILYLIIISLGNILTFQKSYLSIFILTFLFFYLCFVGITNSSLRAFLMIFCWELTKFLNKKSSAISALSFSFVLSVVIDSASLLETGFQLSFTIVLLMIWLCPKKSPSSQKFAFSNYLRFFAGSLSAYLGSFLILLGSFGQVTPISIISNIFLVPAAFPLMVAILFYVFFLIIFKFDFGFILDFIFNILYDFLFLMGSFPLSHFKINFSINAYFYLILPIFLIFYYNNYWSWFKKLLWLTLLSSISVSICLLIHFIKN